MAGGPDPRTVRFPRGGAILPKPLYVLFSLSGGIDLDANFLRCDAPES